MKKRDKEINEALKKSRARAIQKQSFVEYEPVLAEESADNEQELVEDTIDDEAIYDFINELEETINEETKEIQKNEKELIEKIKNVLEDSEYKYFEESGLIAFAVNEKLLNFMLLTVHNDEIKFEISYPFKFDKTRLAAVALTIAEINSNEQLDEKFVLNFNLNDVSVLHKYKVKDFDSNEFKRTVKSLIEVYNVYFDEFEKLFDVEKGEVSSYHQALINVGANIFYRSEKVVKYKPRRYDSLSKVLAECDKRKTKHIDSVDLSSSDTSDSIDE